MAPEQREEQNQHHVSEQLFSAVRATLELSPVPKRLVHELIEQLHPADIADIIEQLPPEQRSQLLSAVSYSQLGEVLAELEDHVQEPLLDQLQPADVAAAIQDLESDDIADIIQHMPQEQAELTLKLLSNRKQQKLYEYDPHTAGGLMRLEVVTASPEMTVEDMLKLLRNRNQELPKEINKIFVVGPRRILLGTITLNQLVRQSPRKKLKNAMDSEPRTLDVDVHEKEIIERFEKYDMNSCPVISHQGYLLGQITVDDVMDTVLERQEKEILHSAGLNKMTDIFATVKDVTRQRLPWLVINLFTAIMASMVIALFEAEIAKLVALAVLMPIIASMGGNAGTQTLTITVRGLATGQVSLRTALHLLRRELLVGGLNGLILGVGLALGTIIFYQNLGLGLVIFIASLGNHLLAAVAGYLIPLALHKMGRDPAVSGGILLTTVTDVGGFFLFLGLAAAVLL